jgi:hypothetical protein
LAAVVVLTASAAEAGKKKKGRNRGGDQQRQAKLRALQAKESALRNEIAMLESRIPIAQQMLQNAQNHLGAKMSSVGGARGEVEEVENRVKELSEKLESIALYAEEKQGDDTPWGRAKAAMLKAQEQRDALIQKILDSAAYEAACKEAEKSPERGRLLAAIRKEFIDTNPEVIGARGLAKRAEADYEQVKRDALAKDSHWVGTVEELKRARAQLTEIKTQLSQNSRDQIITRHTVDRMRSALALMQAALVKDKADLSRVQREKKSLQSQSKHRGRR